MRGRGQCSAPKNRLHSSGAGSDLPAFSPPNWRLPLNGHNGPNRHPGKTGTDRSCLARSSIIDPISGNSRGAASNSHGRFSCPLMTYVALIIDMLVLISDLKFPTLKMREIVHVQAGQCGNQIGAKFWEIIRYFLNSFSFFVSSPSSSCFTRSDY